MHTNPLYNVFTTILKRDLFFGLRRSGELANSLIFFLIVVTMFPFALGTESALLRDIYPGVIWVAALLFVTMSLDRMFNSDFEDGTLEQMLLSQHPTTFIAMAKIVGCSCIDALAQMGIEELADVPIRKLSSGQRRRVALSRLLISGARLWLMDEPFTSLDDSSRLLVKQMVETHANTGGMAVIVTHDPLELPGVLFKKIIFS